MRRQALWTLFFLVILIATFAVSDSYASRRCDPPPFIGVTPRPNILLAFDNSASMYDIAHKGDNFCFDDGYDDAQYYYGYYNTESIYKYDLGPNYFVLKNSQELSSACDNSGDSQNIFCVDVENEIYEFKGNFLNWLAMSKLDLVKKAMTGGKYEEGKLVGESRGCIGRRFVKQIPNSNVSFAVMGTEKTSGTQYGRLYSGGTTQIEVFSGSGNFDLSACNEVLDELQKESPNQGQIKKNIEDCVGYDKQNDKGISAFNTSIHVCWALQKHGRDPTGGDISSIQNNCRNNVYNKGFPPESISYDHPAYVCSDQFVGSCYDENQSGNNQWLGDACVKQKLIDFCGILETPEVIDPSEDFEATGLYSNIPAMLVDSGIIGQLGPPTGPVLLNIKQQSSKPEGLLHDIKDRVNVGLMAFNKYGSNYEMTPEEAYAYYPEGDREDKDGASVFSYIKPENDEIVQSFNDLKAYSWTPIGEMLYEATRYFRGKDSAYSSDVSYESPIEFHCQHNAIVLFSDGESTFDKNLPGSGAVTDTDFDVVDVFQENNTLLGGPEYYSYHGTNYGKAVAYWAHTTNMLSDVEESTLDFYTVFALGGDHGSELLWDIAKYGGFRDINNDGQVTDDEQWDRDQDGIPDNFFSVQEPSQLSGRLKDVFSRILQSAGSAGAVATVTQQVEGEDIVVRGAFTAYEPSDPDNFVWRGHLESYWPHSGCSAYFTQDACEPTANSNCKWEAGKCVGLYDFQKYANIGKFCGEIPNGRCWDAQEKMPSHSDRRIFTMLNGSKTPFTSSHLCGDQDWLALEGDEEFGDSQDCVGLVNWVRGEDWTCGRDRWDPVLGGDAVLGDIVYSTPVVVGQPSLSALPKTVALQHCTPTCDTDECKKKCFYYHVEKHRNRNKMIYVGGNDGMLHAFLAGVWWESGSIGLGNDPSCQNRWIYNPEEVCCGNPCYQTPGHEDIQHIGQEVWAYIPSNLLSELKETARPSYGTPGGCRHIPMVDLSPQVYDVFIDPSGQGIAENREWRTVLVGGQRGGGDVYFAIDVTDAPEPGTSDPIDSGSAGPKVLWEYSVLRNHVEVSAEESFKPYLTFETYEHLKNLPVSFSTPGVGRLRLDNSVTFEAAPPVPPVQESDLTAPTSPPASTKQTWNYQNLSGWVAFLTGSSRVYNETGQQGAVNEKALKPHLLVIDIERGINLFQYTWPTFLAEAESAGIWSQLPSGADPDGDTKIPYALSAPAVLDIWNSEGKVSGDGYTDHLYFGDINGQLYSVKFHPSESRIKIDVRQTKPLDSTLYNSFRSTYQPITTMPVVAFDPQYNLRTYFGTGKFENVWEKIHNDMTDEAKMSLYSFKDPKNVSESLGVLHSESDFFSVIGGLTLQLEFHCSGTSYKGDRSNWVASDGNPDCGESVCTGIDPCWTSIYDFTRNGERVIGSALVAGELLFVTTFVPETDPCGVSVGESYLYIFDYLARPLKKDPLEDSGFERKDAAGFKGQYARIHQDVTQNGTAQSKHIGSVAHLGTGMPSQPVLDSSGKYVLVQTSDAEIQKIRVNLNQRPFYFKGWKLEDEE